ncbi:hypothetical protein KP509_20G029400 [Ceratopteris richardii]|uniref:Trypsin family protein n=1 Tax=Ceratopteris richardii TaxID=49495 RepID=A0A8T2SE30_CERRI|nr:hypothetical protein KP509_20G029400 [Ceratopteris richardii]KAH7331366.1 hypothetical protein KP509_20G029400 [Ceratopteris richardii]
MDHSDASFRHFGQCMETLDDKVVLESQCCSPPVSEESSLDCEFSLSTGSGSQRPFIDFIPSHSSVAGNHYSENSAVYFLWPPVYRPHGSAGERANYFQGLQKEVEFGSIERILKGPQASTLLDLMTIRAYNSKLLRQVSLGTAVGFRTRKGILTDIPAIIVFVAHKVQRAWLRENEILPTHLEGPAGIWCDVDVVEFYYYGAPAFTPKELVYTDLAEGLRGNNPYIGPGSQVASQETLGTLGAIVRSRVGGGQVGFLTNRHVAVNLDYPSQKMYHPLPPPNIGAGVYLGAVERATSFITDEGWYSIFASTNPETFVRADGAFITFAESFDLSRVRTTVDGIGEMGDVINIDLQASISSIVGKQVAKVGRSSGLTRGTIMAYALEYNDEKGICFFTDFLIVGENKQAFDLEGDSGSLILMTEEGSKKPRPVGIIWGGTANRGRLKLRNGLGPENWTSGVDLGRLLEWLQLDLITTQEGLEEAIGKQKNKSIGTAISTGVAPKCPGVGNILESRDASVPPLLCEKDLNLCRWGHNAAEQEMNISSLNKTCSLLSNMPFKLEDTPVHISKELDFGIEQAERVEQDSKGKQQEMMHAFILHNDEISLKRRRH